MQNNPAPGPQGEVQHLRAEIRRLKGIIQDLKGQSLAKVMADNPFDPNPYGGRKPPVNKGSEDAAEKTVKDEVANLNKQLTASETALAKVTNALRNNTRTLQYDAAELRKQLESTVDEMRNMANAASSTLEHYKKEKRLFTGRQKDIIIEDVLEQIDFMAIPHLHAADWRRRYPTEVPASSSALGSSFNWPTVPALDDKAAMTGSKEPQHQSPSSPVKAGKAMQTIPAAPQLHSGGEHTKMDTKSAPESSFTKPAVGQQSPKKQPDQVVQPAPSPKIQPDLPQNLPRQQAQPLLGMKSKPTPSTHSTTTKTTRVQDKDKGVETRPKQNLMPKGTVKLEIPNISRVKSKPGRSLADLRRKADEEAARGEFYPMSEEARSYALDLFGDIFTKKKGRSGDDDEEPEEYEKVIFFPQTTPSTHVVSPASPGLKKEKILDESQGYEKSQDVLKSIREPTTPTKRQSKGASYRPWVDTDDEEEAEYLEESKDSSSEPLKLRAPPSPEPTSPDKKSTPAPTASAIPARKQKRFDTVTSQLKKDGVSKTNQTSDISKPSLKKVSPADPLQGIKLSSNPWANVISRSSEPDPGSDGPQVKQTGWKKSISKTTEDATAPATTSKAIADQAATSLPSASKKEAETPIEHPKPTSIEDARVESTTKPTIESQPSKEDGPQASAPDLKSPKPTKTSGPSWMHVTGESIMYGKKKQNKQGSINLFKRLDDSDEEEEEEEEAEEAEEEEAEEAEEEAEEEEEEEEEMDDDRFTRPIRHHKDPMGLTPPNAGTSAPTEDIGPLAGMAAVDASLQSPSKQQPGDNQGQEVPKYSWADDSPDEGPRSKSKLFTV